MSSLLLLALLLLLLMYGFSFSLNYTVHTTRNTTHAVGIVRTRLDSSSTRVTILDTQEVQEISEKPRPRDRNWPGFILFEAVYVA